MNRKPIFVLSALLLGCSASLAASAASADGHPQGPACMDIKWNAELLKMYPRAPAACQEVVVRNGTRFARFDALVTAVGPDGVSVRFRNVAGDPGREIVVKPGPQSMVTIAGKRVAYAKLAKGDELTFWVPERQVGVISDPEDTDLSQIVLR